MYNERSSLLGENSNKKLKKKTEDIKKWNGFIDMYIGFDDKKLEAEYKGLENSLSVRTYLEGSVLGFLYDFHDGILSNYDKLIAIDRIKGFKEGEYNNLHFSLEEELSRTTHRENELTRRATAADGLRK